MTLGDQSNENSYKKTGCQINNNDHSLIYFIFFYQYFELLWTPKKNTSQKTNSKMYHKCKLNSKSKIQQKNNKP